MYKSYLFERILILFHKQDIHAQCLHTHMAISPGYFLRPTNLTPPNVYQKHSNLHKQTLEKSMKRNVPSFIKA